MRSYFPLFILLIILLSVSLYLFFFGFSVLPAASIAVIGIATVLSAIIIANEFRRPLYHEYNRKKALFPKIPDKYLTTVPPSGSVVFGKDYHTNKTVAAEPGHHTLNDIYWALQTNSAERLLIGLCGWGANSLAKLARIVPSEEADLISCDDSATLIVRWNDGKISTSECSINTFAFEVEEFEDEVFTPHAYDSEVEAVFVEVKLELSDSKYCFACITEEERERTSDEFSYWYSLKRDNDD